MRTKAKFGGTCVGTSVRTKAEICSFAGATFSHKRMVRGELSVLNFCELGRRLGAALKLHSLEELSHASLRLGFLLVIPMT